MNSGFEELLKLFNASGVKYLVVGGHAMMLYTEPRYTKDLDVWIEASEENAAKVFGAERAYFIGRADLIRNKRASGRHIDLHDAGLLGQG